MQRVLGHPGKLVAPSSGLADRHGRQGEDLEVVCANELGYLDVGAIIGAQGDGANIELAQLVGEDNIKIFGLRTEEVDKLRAEGGYFAWDLYNKYHDSIGRIVDRLTDDTYARLSGNFQSVRDELMVNNDHDLVLADYASYIEAWEELSEAYGERRSWNRSAIHNTSQSGYFSSDRTIREYASEIWHIGE